MSLATRCTSCGTIFRLGQDQLKVSDGWVRCGRCEEVFNALQSLFDLDREAPPPWPPSPANESEWHSTSGHQGNGSGPEGVTPVELEHVEPASAELAPSEARSSVDEEPPNAQPLLRAASSESPGWHIGEGAEPPVSSGEVSAGPLAVGPHLAREATPEVGTEGGLQLSAPAPDLKELPSFVRPPVAAAQPRSHRFRAAGWLVLLVLSALALAGQAAMHFHSSLAARSPALADAMTAICRSVGYTLDPPLRLESVAVDSSGLTKAEGAGLYRLSVVLHNRGDIEVRVPAIDLSLSDAQGTLLARKVLLASELGVTHQSIAPGADLPLHGTLDTGDIPIAGYTVEIFYP